MDITRNITQGLTLTIALSPEELELAYREQEHNYHIQDAKRHIAEYVEGDEDQYVGILCDDVFIEKCIARFEEEFDCNVGENSQWENAIAFILDDWRF